MESYGPRAISGGRSPRYEERRLSRETHRGYAAAWSDATASVCLEELHSASSSRGMQIVEFMLVVFADTTAMNAFAAQSGRRLDPGGRRVLKEIMETHRDRVHAYQASGDLAGAKAQIRRFLKPLRARRAAGAAVGELKIGEGNAVATTFHVWLSKDPTLDRLRDISRSCRIMKGVSRWPLGWLERPGVICYERAVARVTSERGGFAEEQFLRGVVHQTNLPTAVAAESDHYVVVGPGGSLPRFMSVEEVGRGFGLEKESALMRMLTAPEVLTVNQAVACLGRGVHVGVARQVVMTLRARGHLRVGLRYGSSYSGIDTFAAGVDAVFGEDWKYTFASERDPTSRAALLSAWGARGLSAEACFEDACTGGAVAAPCVDLWVCTPSCEAYSKRNHSRDAALQRSMLSDVWRSLEYVRRSRPRVVVLENVTEPSVVGPVTGLLTRLKGYTVETGELDPRTCAGAPMARTRQYWILTRVGE